MTDTLDITKPVQTRSGGKARIVATDLTGPYPILAVLTDGNGSVRSETYQANGWEYASREGEDDLVNTPETRERFLNLGQAYGAAKFAASEYPEFGVLRLVTEAGTDKIIATEILPATSAA